MCKCISASISNFLLLGWQNKENNQGFVCFFHSSTLLGGWGGEISLLFYKWRLFSVWFSTSSSLITPCISDGRWATQSKDCIYFIPLKSTAVTKLPVSVFQKECALSLTFPAGGIANTMAEMGESPQPWPVSHVSPAVEEPRCEGPIDWGAFIPTLN